MQEITFLEPWWHFGVALLIGALLGLEREFIQQKEEVPDFAGIRTFSLIALLGAVAAFLGDLWGLMPIAIALAGLILLTTASYIGELMRSGKDVGITTEVAALLTFFFGVLAMSEYVRVAIVLSVITALLLSLKGKLHDWIRRMNVQDIRVTFQFAIVAAVVLPLLPDQEIDPFGLLNPFRIWLMVVFVSGIGFSGYVLMKVLGPSRGINLMGLLGGLASSTASTISFATASRQNPDMSALYARAAVLASSVMIPRVLLWVLVLAPPLLIVVGPALLAMFVSGLVIAYVLQRRSNLDESNLQRSFQVSNPLKLSTAIKFGLLFALVLLIVEFSQSILGDSGVYLTSIVTGVTDVDAITLSVSRLVGNSQMEVNVAGTAIIIATLMNTLSKGAIAASSGTPELRRIVLPALGLILLVGLIGGVLTVVLM
ncbi:MAG: MgtC/SapB family protein [Anaerolineales bacterium]